MVLPHFMTGSGLFRAGKIQIRICNGTSCFLNGSQSIIKKIREETGILPGQTTRDGNFSYEIVILYGRL